MRRGRKLARVAVAGVVAAAACGCATIGHEFEVGNVPRLAIGRTSRADVLEMFGTPWRTGLEDGRTTWTYGHYRYSLFGPEKTRDLVVRFDAQGKLASYTFSSTEAEDLAGGGVATGAARP